MLTILQVGFSWVASATEDAEPVSVSTIPAGAMLECVLPEQSYAAPPASHSGSAAAGQPAATAEASPVEDAEEEEAFLEAVTVQRSAVDAPSQPQQVALLRVRGQGSKQWAALCSLLAGSGCDSGATQHQCHL